MNTKILIVDDEKLKRVTLEAQLNSEGFEVKTAGNAYEGANCMEDEDFDIVITDLKMPGKDGLTFLKEINANWPGTAVIIMTAYGTVQTAVEAMKAGAYDYITKPFTFDELQVRLDKIITRKELEKELLSIREKIQSQYGFHNFVGKSFHIKKLIGNIQTIASDDCTVLIEGETGTGKEVVANSIHYNSLRKGRAFIKVSCASLSREVLESELFGHEKGAFTGAVRQKKGRFELADRGTLFLDEIDDVPLDIQLKLLRFLQERRIERVGGEKTILLDVRVICATKADLTALIAQGRFREDLYYRLNVAHLKIPPLRDRKEDIVPLVSFFLEKYSEIKGKPRLNISTDVLDLLKQQDWPGNVRELENAVERAVAFCASDTIRVSDLPEYLYRKPDTREPVRLVLEGRDVVKLPRIIDQVENDLIEWALKRASGNQQMAAEILGIPRTTLRDKMTRLKSREEPL